MLGRKWLVVSLAVLFVLGIIGIVSAHGVRTEHRFFVEDGIVKIEICATYDVGEPMSEAQVAIFSPNDLANPWKTGQTDKAGCFTFAPDLSIPGTWDVQVRLAGHGDMMHIEITGDEGKTLKSESGEAAAEKSTEESLVEGTVDKTEAEKVAASQEPVYVVVGGPAGNTAPLVQIVVNDGSVVVGDATLPTGAKAVHSAPVGVGYSTAQIVVMAACVIWGFIGTALFFASRRK